MKMILITPSKDCLYAEILEKASDNLNCFIRQKHWLKWKKRLDINGKRKMQWYIVVDITSEKDKRLSDFSDFVCNVEHYEPSPRICPHDLYYEDFVQYFEPYRKTD